MGKLVVSQFVTIDGVAEDPGGSEGFDRGGWAFQFDRGPIGDQFKLDEVAASDALLLGRTTYDGYAAAWPSRSGDFADKFNTMPKHVVSSTLRDPTWSNSTVIDRDVPAAVEQLKRATPGDVLVNGSIQLVQTLATHNLVDEYRLMVFPVVLGAGRRLFHSNAAPIGLRMTDSRPAGDTVILTYVPRS